MSALRVFGYVVLVVAIVGSIWFVLGFREQECYDRGGVALVSLRENICVDADGRVLR